MQSTNNPLAKSKIYSPGPLGLRLTTSNSGRRTTATTVCARRLAGAIKKSGMAAIESGDLELVLSLLKQREYRSFFLGTMTSAFMPDSAIVLAAKYVATKHTSEDALAIFMAVYDWREKKFRSGFDPDVNFIVANLVCPEEYRPRVNGALKFLHWKGAKVSQEKDALSFWAICGARIKFEQISSAKPSADRARTSRLLYLMGADQNPLEH